MSTTDTPPDLTPLLVRLPSPPDAAHQRLLTERLAGHTTSPVWLPEQAWPELNALRDEQLRMRGQLSDRRAAGDKWHREHPAWPSYGQVVRLFGSWRRLLATAEMTALTRPWTQDEIVAALRRHRAAHGRLPTAREWTRRGVDHPPASTVVLRFGSWSAAARAATVPN